MTKCYCLLVAVFALSTVYAGFEPAPTWAPADPDQTHIIIDEMEINQHGLTLYPSLADAQPSATTTIHLALYTAPSANGPFTLTASASATLQHADPKPLQLFTPHNETYQGYFARQTLFLADGRRLIDIPPYQLDHPPKPIIKGDTISWPKARNLATTAASIEFVATTSGAILPFTIAYGTTTPTAIPDWMRHIPTTVFMVHPRTTLSYSGSTFGDWKAVTQHTQLDLKLPYSPPDPDLIHAILPSLNFANDQVYDIIPPTALTSSKITFVGVSDANATLSTLKQRCMFTGDFKSKDGQHILLECATPPTSLKFKATMVGDRVQMTWPDFYTKAFGSLFLHPLVLQIDAQTPVALADGQFTQRVPPNSAPPTYAPTLQGSYRIDGWIRGPGKQLLATRLSLPLAPVTAVVPAPPPPEPSKPPIVTIGLKLSELTYSGTGEAHIAAYCQLVKRLAGIEGAMLLDRVNVAQLVGEMQVGSALQGQEKQLNPLQHIIRFTDFSRVNGQGIGLWFTSLASRTNTQIGEVYIPADADHIRSTLIEPAYERLLDVAKETKPPPRTELPIKTLVFGKLTPIEQVHIATSADAIADEWAVALASALADQQVLTRDQFEHILIERTMSKTADQQTFFSGEVLLSGRIWRNSDRSHGLFIMATDIQTTEILGAWSCDKDDDDALTQFATWAGTLKRYSPITLPDHPVARRNEQSIAPINPLFEPPKAQLRATKLIQVTGDMRDLSTLTAAATELWKNGDHYGAIEQLEAVWLKRAAIKDTGVREQLPTVCLQLADYYHAKHEYVGEFELRQWYQELVDAHYVRTQHPLNAIQAKVKLMRAKSASRNSDRAKELAARGTFDDTVARDVPKLQLGGKKVEQSHDKVNHTETATIYVQDDIGLIRQSITINRRPLNPITATTVSVSVLFPNTKRWYTIPEVELGAVLPARLNPRGIGSPVINRAPNDPLASVRPVVARDCPPSRQAFGDLMAAYIADDYEAWRRGCYIITKRRQALAKAGRRGNEAWQLLNMRGQTNVQLYEIGGVDEGLPDFANWSKAYYAELLANRPYLTTRAFMQADRNIIGPVLLLMKEDAFKAEMSYDRTTRESHPTQLANWNHHMAMMILARMGDPEAKEFRARSITKARAAFNSDKDRLKQQQATLILASEGDQAAKLRLANTTAQSNLLMGLPSQREDVYRMMLDLGIKDFDRKLRTNTTFHAEYMCWRDVNEAKWWASKYPESRGRAKQTLFELILP